MTESNTENGVYGQLNEDEKARFVASSSQIQVVETRIGRLEVQKAMLLQQHAELQHAARETITAAAHRLGVPPETPFRLNGDLIVSDGPSS